MPTPASSSDPHGALHLRELMQTLLQEIEANNPIDFADLATDENLLRQRCVGHVLRQFVQGHEMGLDPQSAVISLLTTTAHLLLENVTLHARLMQSQSGNPVDVEQLLSGIFRRPGRS
jgi:hypothetical protein